MNALPIDARFTDSQPSSRSRLATGAAIAMIDAAIALLPIMESGARVDSAAIKSAMTEAFRGTDAEGAWDWKTAYDACEVASVLFC